jgi:AmmeMemoRadiSam system protein A
VTLSEKSRSTLLELARIALRQKLVPGDAPPPPMEIDPELMTPAGCFVTLHELATKRLRGCVGRIEAAKPLWETVYVTAGETLNDPRFVNQRVSGAELANLELEISVLSPPREASGPLDFDLLNDGIYLTCGGRAGFFLTQVAQDTGWTKEQLLARLCSEKMGLPPESWRGEGVKLYTFKVEVVGPAAFGTE